MEKVIELIRSAGDGALAIDRLQRIVFWNDACEEILGYRADEVLGRPCHEVIGGSAEDGCRVCRRNCTALLERARHAPVPTRQLTVRHKDGRNLWISVSTLTVPSSWSDLSVLFHLIRDITLHKRIEALVGSLTADVAELAATAHGSGEREVPDVTITERERQILLSMSSGKTSSEIADELKISKATVRNHIHHILAKLGVRNRLEAVLLGLRAGLL